MNINEMFRDLGLRAPPQYAIDVLALTDPETNLMNSGAVQLSRNAFDQLMEYSHSLPTGQRPGKVWKAQFRSGWFLGRYGKPYPEGHEHHGQIPIGWWPIYILGQPAAWPRDVRVPPPARPGPVAAPLGGADGEEGDHCLRDTGKGFCLSRIEYLPDATLGSCWCPTGNPPCGYCTSSAPECPGCGWRADDAAR